MNNGNQADSVVKRPHHFFFRYITGLPQICKYRRHIPTVFAQYNITTFRDNSNNIICNSATGNMGQSKNRQIFDNAVNGLRVYPCGSKEFFTDGSAEF